MKQKTKPKLIRPGANTKKARAHGFKKGDPRPAGAGRPKGQQNRVTTMLRDAILLAADDVGEDGEGLGKCRGYLRYLAKRFPELYVPLLAKVLPLQVAVHAPPQKLTPLEAVEKLKERNLPVPPALMSMAAHEIIERGGVPFSQEEDYEEELNGRGPMNMQDEDEPLDDVEYSHVER